MPNVKIHVDASLLPARETALVAALSPLRALLCGALGVAPAVCQLALLPVIGLPDQPGVNVEVQIMPHPDRSRDRLLTLAAEVQTMMAAAAGCPVAVRITTLNPDGYIALK